MAAAFNVLACGSFTGACTLELRVALTPEAQQLAVGERFTPSVALSGCGGKKQLDDRFSWMAVDSAVASVDAQTGQTVGLSPGATRVLVHGEEYGALGAIDVTVSSVVLP